MLKFTLLISFALLNFVLFGCSASNSNQNATTPLPTPSPSPSPTPTEEERAIIRENNEKERRKALEDYLSKEYAGWKSVGVSEDSADLDCTPDYPCTIHLSKGKDNKVLTLLIKQFVRTDGTTYLLVYPATSIDILKGRLESIKRSEREIEREETLASLTFDDCETVINDTRDESYERDYEPPDYP